MNPTLFHQLTIEALQPNVTFGQRYNMSTIDIFEVRSFYKCLPTGITLPPMPTTTTVNLYVMNTSISSSWTTNSETLSDSGGSGLTYYYGVFEVTVSANGDYIFKCSSAIDTFGLLYKENFYSNSLPFNLIKSDDNSGGNEQFQIEMYLESNTRYLLVATTIPPSTTGDYTLLVSGLNRVNMVRINSSSIIPTTTTAPLPSTEEVLSIYSNTLTTNNPIYDRLGGFGQYYYEAILISVSKSGFYIIESNSGVDTYGYLYLNNFNPSHVQENLITGNDDYGGNYHFIITHTLQFMKRYILIVTTNRERVLGPFSIGVTGPDTVKFTSMNNTLSTLTTPAGSTSRQSPTVSYTTPAGSTNRSSTTVPSTPSSASRKSDMIMIYHLTYIIVGYVLNYCI